MSRPDPNKRNRIGTVYEDVTTEVLGDIGFWQKILVFVCFVLMTNCIFSHHEEIYLVPPTTNNVVCIPSEIYIEVYNETLCTFTPINSTTELKCDRWYVKLMWVFWIKKSWIIFCDDKMKLLLTAVIYRLARMFGFIIFGLIADSFGRKKAIIIDVFGTIALRLVIIFCDSEGWFKLVLFMLSLIGSANIYMVIVIICEIASNKWRSCLSVIVMSPRLVAAVCSVPLATATPNAETFNVIACFFGIGYICILKWLPESPQWLLYNRKISVAERVLINAAQQNNINFSAEFKIRPVNERAYHCLDETTTCVRILTIQNVRTIITVSLLFWGLLYFFWSTLYFKIYRNGFTRTLLLKIIIIFAILGCLGILLSKKLLLQQLIVINILLAGIFTTGVGIFPQPNANEIISAFAMASGLMVNTVNLMITPRMYAINVRATVFGFCHAMGQLGALISYIFFIYDTLSNAVFVALEIGVSLVLIAISFMLPHVDGRELPDVLEDMDYFSELSKPLRWATQKLRSPSKEEVEMRIYSFGSVLTNHSGVGSTSLDNRRRSRPPAQDIGCKRLWHRTIAFTRDKLQRIQRFFRKTN